MLNIGLQTTVITNRMVSAKHSAIIVMLSPSSKAIIAGAPITFRRPPNRSVIVQTHVLDTLLNHAEDRVHMVISS